MIFLWTNWPNFVYKATFYSTSWFARTLQYPSRLEVGPLIAAMGSGGALWLPQRAPTAKLYTVYITEVLSRWRNVFRNVPSFFVLLAERRSRGQLQTNGNGVPASQVPPHSHPWPLLPPKFAKSRTSSRKFELIAARGRSRSSILVPPESAYATSY